MATSTLTTLRARMSELIDDYTAIEADAGSTTTISATELQLYQAADNGSIKGSFVICTSGTNVADGEIARVTAYDHTGGASEQLMTVAPAFTGAVVDTDTFELHKYDPSVLNRTVQRAIRQLQDVLYLPLVDETLKVDNLLANWSFETFSSGFTSWSEVGSPTANQNTGHVFHGSNSAIITAGSSANPLLQDLIGNTDSEVQDWQSKTSRAHGRVWSSSANARIRISFDGSTFTDSPDHGGTGEWERFEVSATITADPTVLYVVCGVDTGGTAYFDDMHASIDGIYRYTIPSSMITLSNVYHNAQEAKPDGLFVPTSQGKPPRGRILRLEGKGRLTVPSVETGTTELDDVQVELVANRAATLFAQSQLHSGDSKWSDIITESKENEGILRGSPGARQRRVAVQQRNGYGWHTEEDSSGRYLVFER